MQVEAKAKWQQSSFKKNDIQGFSLKGLLLRILIYSGVLVNLILPLYDFNSNRFLVDGTLAKLIAAINPLDALQEAINPLDAPLHNINALNRAQEAYFKETGYFSDSIEKLGVGIRDTERYSYRILSPMSYSDDFLPMKRESNEVYDHWFSHRRRVFMLAQAKDPQYKSYLGKVETIQEIRDAKAPSQYKSAASLGSQVCEIDSRTLVPDPSCNLLLD